MAYGSDRARRLELGQASVIFANQLSAAETVFAGEDDGLRTAANGQGAGSADVADMKTLSAGDFSVAARERIGHAKRYPGQALVFIHGFNMTFDAAAQRAAKIAQALKYDGLVFVYSWPSDGRAASYTYDRESAEGAEPYLRQFLETVVKESGAKSVSIIAHGMGNQPLMNVLRDMKSAAPEGVIGQVILVAPDVDADNFTNLARSIAGFAKGVTLYASSNDRALSVSRDFWGNYRAGDVPVTGPLVVPGIDTIDVTGMSTDAFALSHSGYAENETLLRDIGQLLLYGLRPPDLRLPNLKKVATVKGEYWRYVNGADTNSTSAPPARVQP